MLHAPDEPPRRAFGLLPSPEETLSAQERPGGKSFYGNSIGRPCEPDPATAHDACAFSGRIPRPAL
ncbi:hypothetical protein GCM10009125_06270 [Castellaniella daejeonensis]|uniref:Uncharacterized protein n=1 Tax=Castellaniella daejeonensis TaxID=659013 RepID=A0ABN0TF73_9BURK